MNWLVGYVMASMVGAFVVMRVFDHLFAGVVGGVTSVARVVLFIGAWTAITAISGMRCVTRYVRQARSLIGHNSR